jgi:PKHD-type hydroxylase
MTLILQAVLTGEELERVRQGLGETGWRAGKRTAGAAARPVKENQQADSNDRRVQALERFVLDALKRHPLFDVAARPRRFSRLLFSRYEPGMQYGPHTDDALMGGEDALMRTDLAFTLFLAERAAYEGGALVISSALGEQVVCLEAGDAILYPANSIHHVAPVTRGVRLAAVGWVQSLVADHARREVLFDLATAHERLAQAGAARVDLLALDKSISNLLRMWAAP